MNIGFRKLCNKNSPNQVRALTLFLICFYTMFACISHIEVTQLQSMLRQNLGSRTEMYYLTEFGYALRKMLSINSLMKKKQEISNQRINNMKLLDAMESG